MLHRNSHTRISQPVFFSSLFLFSFFFYFGGRRWIAITVKRGNGLARMMHTLFSFFQIAFCHFLFPLSLWRCRFLLLYTVSSSSRCFLSGDQRRFTLRACWWFRGCRLACPSRKESSIHPTISLLFHSSQFKSLFVAECTFGKQIRELGSTWFADLGPPFGVMYCIKCECIPVRIKVGVPSCTFVPVCVRRFPSSSSSSLQLDL